MCTSDVAFFGAVDVGADVVVARETANTPAEIEALNGKKIDVVADVVGGEDFTEWLEVLRRGGKYVTAGAIAGPVVDLDLRTLYLKDLELYGATVFESAVKSKVRDEVTRLQENYENEIEEGIKSNKAELTEKVDTYMNYVVEEWMKENELAVERGLKGEIAEDFIAGLKQLFEDHYVDIPDEKYDVLQAQSDKIAELEEKVNKSIEESIEFKKSNDSLTRDKVISEVSSDLADTEIEKFKGLTEDVDFGNEEDFRSKLDTLKESYFPRTIKETTSDIDNVETGPAQDIDITDSMAAYSKAIGTAVKGASK